MLDRLLNNRKEWNALKEQHDAKMAAIEAAKKAKEEEAQNAAAARQGEQNPNRTASTRRTPQLLLFPSSSHSECSAVQDVRAQLKTQTRLHAPPLQSLLPPPHPLSELSVGFSVLASNMFVCLLTCCHIESQTLTCSS